jgi:hypothetical protein
MTVVRTEATKFRRNRAKDVECDIVPEEYLIPPVRQLSFPQFSMTQSYHKFNSLIVFTEQLLSLTITGVSN